jgi:hypothetical protein
MIEHVFWMPGGSHIITTRLPPPHIRHLCLLPSSNNAMPRRSLSTAPIPSPPSSPTTMSMASVAQTVLLKVRRSPSKQDQIKASSGPPQTHPCIRDRVARSPSLELVETWICRDAVEPATLLRATREAFLAYAAQFGANALADEKYVPPA